VLALVDVADCTNEKFRRFRILTEGDIDRRSVFV